MQESYEEKESSENVQRNVMKSINGDNMAHRKKATLHTRKWQYTKYVWTLIREYIAYETTKRYVNVLHKNKTLNLSPGNSLQRWRLNKGIFGSKESERVLCQKSGSISYATQIFRNDPK